MAETVPQSDRLLSAVLLAAVGGLLDASVYLIHGHVFANAMTGNVIFLGISTVNKDWQQVIAQLIPICAFLMGVAASRLLRTLPQNRGMYGVLGVEMITLCIAGFLPASFPDRIFTAIISFVSAFQVSTFRRVGKFSYNSTFTTGNLRETADSWVISLISDEPEVKNESRAKAGKLIVICLFFLAGAALGAWTAPLLGNRSLWLAEPLLLIVLLRTAFL